MSTGAIPAPIAIRALVSCVLLSVALAGYAQTEPPDEAWNDCWTPGPQINVGGQSVEFVANTGQIPGSAASTSNFPGGELGVGAGGEISLSLRATKHFQSADAELIHLDALEPQTSLEGPVGRSVVDAELSAPVPIFASTVLQEIYPGVTLHLSGRTRDLRLRYELTPGSDLSRIAWHLSGVASSVSTPPKIEIELESSTTALGLAPRKLRLYSPRAWQGDGEPISIAWRLAADGSLGFDVESYDPQQALEIEAVIEHSRFLVPDVSVWDAAGGGLYAAEDGGSGSRVSVRRFDAEGKSSGDTVYLDRAAGDVVAAAVTSEEETYLFGNLAAGEGQYLAVLPAEGSVRLSSLELPGQARGMTVDSEGRVFVAVASDNESLGDLPPLQQLHLVSSQEIADESYAFVELDPASMQPVAYQQVSGPSLDRLALWTDCDGKVTGGLPARKRSGNGEHQRLESNEIDLDSFNGFAEHPNRWGQYLLQWKQFRASYQAGGSPVVNPPIGSAFWQTVFFNPANAQGTAPVGPILDVGIGASQAKILNDLEDDLTVFPGGDPPGGWQYGDATSLPELAVAVGLYLDKTSSPLAARLNIAGQHRAAVITAVEFCLQGGVFTRIQDLIPGWDNTGTWGPGGINPIDVVDGQWAVQYGNSLFSPDYFEVVQLDVTHWPGSGSNAMNEDQSFGGNLLNNLFTPPTQGAQVATDWVADPPETAPAASDVVREAASRLAPGMLQKVEAVHRCFAAGELVHEHQETALVRYSDFAGKGAQQ